MRGPSSILDGLEAATVKRDFTKARGILAAVPDPVAAYLSF